MDNKIEKPPVPQGTANVFVGNFAGSDPSMASVYGAIIIGDDIRKANSMEVRVGDKLFGYKLEEPIKLALVQLCTKLRDLQMEKVNLDGIYLENDDNKLRPNS